MGMDTFNHLILHLTKKICISDSFGAEQRSSRLGSKTIDDGPMVVDDDGPGVADDQ